MTKVCVEQTGHPAKPSPLVAITELEAIVRIASELDVWIARLALWIYSHIKTAD